jgi:hypothetical protein
MAKHSYFAQGTEIIDGGKSAPDFILANPESFGMTQKELIATYQSFDEEYGSKGEAIMHILHDVISKGWLIVDQDSAGETWILVFDSMEKEKNRIISFLMKLAKEKKYLNLNDGLRAYGLDDGFRYDIKKNGIVALLTFIVTEGKIKIQFDENGQLDLFSSFSNSCIEYDSSIK